LVLLTICNEVQPVLNDLTELDETPPAIKHFWLEVVISPVPVLPAPDRSGYQFETLFTGLKCHIFDLVWSKAFACHKILQVSHIELLI